MDNKLLDANVRALNSLKRDHNIEVYEKEFLTVYTYDAVSLEGKNKMTYEKVKRLIELGDKSDYSEREVKEILNHVKAYNYIIELSNKKNHLTEEDIKDIHDILEEEISIGGVYRNVNIQIPGATHQPPDNIKVYDRMKRLFRIIEEEKLTPFDEGVLIHANLAKIHPFLDANGRLGRLVLNFYLIKSNYLPITISLNKRNEYFKSIDTFKVEKDINPLKEFIITELNERYNNLIEKIEN